MTMLTPDHALSGAAETLTLIDDETSRTWTAAGGTKHGSSPAGRVVANWHDQNHPGAFLTCYEQPCHAVREVDQ